MAEFTDVASISWCILLLNFIYKYISFVEEYKYIYVCHLQAFSAKLLKLHLADVVSTWNWYLIKIAEFLLYIERFAIWFI